MDENPYRSPESEASGEPPAREFPDFSPESYRAFWKAIFWILVACIPAGILISLARYS